VDRKYQFGKVCKGRFHSSNTAQHRNESENVVNKPSVSKVIRTSSDQLVAELTALFGPLVGGDDLIKILCYRNPAAFRQAQRQGRLGVRVFNLPARRGKFALTKDVAAWMQLASEVQ
jgi:hypothetical protein